MFAHPSIEKGSKHSTQKLGHASTIPSSVCVVYVIEIRDKELPPDNEDTSAFRSM